MTIRDVFAEMESLGVIAHYSDADEIAGLAAFKTMVKSATQTDESRLARAQQAYISVAHYERLLELSDISDETRRFLLHDLDGAKSMADLLLSDASEARINEEVSLLMELDKKRF